VLIRRLDRRLEHAFEVRAFLGVPAAMLLVTLVLTVLPLDRYAARNANFVLVTSHRIAVLAAQSAARDTGNQPRGSAGISRGGAPWLVILRPLNAGNTMIDLATVRRTYAEELRAIAHLRSEALVEALARVPREHFLGPGPWQIVVGAPGRRVEYETTGDGDPRHVYRNVLVAIDAERSLNNGQPAGVVSWIERLELKDGEHVLHVGCGTGYYTAILAELVGLGGRVVALEIDAQLARRARVNLGDLPQVEVQEGDGNTVSPGAVDAIFVNAGATHSQEVWLDALREGGRLLLPITAAIDGSTSGVGGIFLITRRPAGFSATYVSPVAVYSCLGCRDTMLNQEICRKRGSESRVQSLRRDGHDEDETCWLHRRGSCLSTLTLATGHGN
jgi:protein-L-isoaspartate(D-aspartate) O-methyltransferase